MNRRVAPTTLSQRMVDRIQPGQWLSENLGYGLGSLQVRGTSTGGRYYLRIGAGRSRISLGAAKGRNRLILDEARRRAWATSAAERHRILPQKALGALLEAYCETLAENGSDSGASTRAMLYRHVRNPHPQLWLQSAPSVTAQQIVSVLDRLVAAGKIATAGKLRASLNAAFNRALRADLCVQSPLMRGFALTHNPIARIASLSPPRVAAERVLTSHELRALWCAMSEVNTPAGAILRFYLLTGGQRLVQLLRARHDNLVEGGVLLFDPKGRRPEPRPHLVPITNAAQKELAAIPSEGPYLLTQDVGGVPPHPATLFRHLQSVTGRLVDDGQASEGINFAALRRTIETQLAAAGVPALVRAHLQSHGLDGIQTRHYDRHTYFHEKRAALDTLFGLFFGYQETGRQ
ncbi:MAG: hypothetical protein GVY36_16540 [Verrucomicrobia bacterium]|nr:hypothetical protein [Verrucomicrobiota bacterium]